MVLVIEDDRDARLLHADAVARLDAQLVTADSAQRGYEVAQAILFFASRRSDYITGQVLSVSGGLTMAG